MPYFDTHAHLDVEQFDADRDQVVAAARRAEVTWILCPGITADSSLACAELAQRTPSVFAAVGIQPNSCGEAQADDWDRVVAMAEMPGVVALGETGLDLHWDFTPIGVQQDYFDRHLRLAGKLDLPVVIHCREAADDLLPMLRQAEGQAPLRGILHAFSGDESMAAECVALGLHVSFAGPVTYTNKKFKSLQAAARAVPDDRLLIETDSPYLTPHPLRGKQKRNEPSNVVLVAQCLAELRGVSLEVIAAQTTANARRLFGV